jgi:hypothetical protein
MRLFWFLFFVLLSTGTFAQALRCTFTDIQTKDSIPNVRCWLVVKGDTLSYALSQRNGSLTFDLKGINVAPKEAYIVFTHPFYQEGKFVLPYFEPNDTIRKTIQLKAERIQEEKEVVLRPNKPDTVYASTTYSVADFELDAKGALLLLTYEKNLQKDAQLQVVKNHYTAAILSIPERAQS